MLNPNAFFRKPLTMEEVMASKMLSTPLRAKMSNMLFDGGCAFIITSAERARAITEKPVYLLGEGGVVTHFVFSQEPDVSRFGWARAGKAAFEMAGLTPQDMDIAEIYDSYPIYQMIGFEELGFAERGQGGEMFLQGDTWPGGKIPTTTNGGMLSQGHTGAGGACALMVETVRQLMGKAGDRQVKMRNSPWKRLLEGPTWMPRLRFWGQRFRRMKGDTKMDTPVKPKPVPVVNPWAKPFWDAAREEKLVIQHCQDCGANIFYPRIACPNVFRIMWSGFRRRGKVPCIPTQWWRAIPRRLLLLTFRMW